MATQVSTRLLNSWRSTIVSGIKAAANLRSISSKAERTARAELLEYQLKELNEFNPQAGEFEQIDEEYKRLANSGQLLSTSQTALNMLADGEDVNLQSQLYNVRQLVTELTGMDNKLSGVLEMLEEAAIQISEAGMSCATTVNVWISTRTVCSSLSNASPVRFHWRVSITLPRRAAELLSVSAGGTAAVGRSGRFP